MTDWKDCKNILCIRPDNMGDLIMSGPAIRALKETFGARITLLTSSVAKAIAAFMPEIDETIVFDLPWVKTERMIDNEAIHHLIDALKFRRFDAAVIFTVYSQNPLPTAMLAYMAGIPKVLAYCRENPYGLLTHWLPDEEPYSFIRHQVRRDLDLVKAVGAAPAFEGLCLQVPDVWNSVSHKLERNGIKLDQPWLILHAGVSEVKRQYPLERWVEAAQKIINELGFQVLLTGSAPEKSLTDKLQSAIGKGSYSIAGHLDMGQFICLVQHAPVMASVNTGTTHIAAAVGTPVVVLYAQTNPQHTPWKVPCKVLQFPVAEELRSRNEVIRFVNQKLYARPADMPGPEEIVSALTELLHPVDSPVRPLHEIPGQSQAIEAS
ncbi:MAG: glycosyltransferase family 9 protein [Bacteroidetes bacterium]|nr:glycosyltransferase family 9 protein [Bacteroidota bacterium]